MKGGSLNFTGSDNIKAKAEYIHNGKVLFKAEATNFSAKDRILKSNLAAMTLYIGNNDSVTHPNVSGIIKNNEFSFTRNSKGTGNLPFMTHINEFTLKPTT